MAFARRSTASMISRAIPLRTMRLACNDSARRSSCVFPPPLDCGITRCKSATERELLIVKLVAQVYGSGPKHIPKYRSVLSSHSTPEEVHTPKPDPHIQPRRHTTDVNRSIRRQNHRR